MIDYTNCDQQPDSISKIPDRYVSSVFKTPLGSATNDRPYWKAQKNVLTTDPAMNITNPGFLETVCTIQFKLPNDLKPPIFLYYRLTNFYQNHRRYVQSLDAAQLRGEARSLSALEGAGDCDPLPGDTETIVKKPYYPCGLIANSQSTRWAS